MSSPSSSSCPWVGSSLLGQPVVAEVVVEGGVGLDRAEVGPALGRVAGLLAQLAPRGLGRGLARIDHAARDLDGDRGRAEAVLAHAHQAPLGRQRHDVDPVGRLEHEAHELLARARVGHAVEARGADEQVRAGLARDARPGDAARRHRPHYRPECWTCASSLRGRASFRCDSPGLPCADGSRHARALARARVARAGASGAARRAALLRPVPDLREARHAPLRRRAPWRSGASWSARRPCSRWPPRATAARPCRGPGDLPRLRGLRPARRGDQHGRLPRGARALDDGQRRLPDAGDPGLHALHRRADRAGALRPAARCRHHRWPWPGRRS